MVKNKFRCEVVSVDDLMSMNGLIRFHSVAIDRHQTLMEHTAKVIIISRKLLQYIREYWETNKTEGKLNNICYDTLYSKDIELQLYDYALTHDVLESSQIWGDSPSVSYEAKAALKKAEEEYWAKTEAYQEPFTFVKHLVKLADVVEGRNFYFHNSKKSPKQSKILDNWHAIFEKHLLVTMPSSEVAYFSKKFCDKLYSELCIDWLKVDPQHW